MIRIAEIQQVSGVALRNHVNNFFLREQAILFWVLSGATLGLGTRTRGES